MSPPAAGPLEGMTVGRLGPGPVSEIAAWLLSGLGAEVWEVEPSTSAFQPRRVLGVTRPKARRADLIVADIPEDIQRPAGLFRRAPLVCPSRGVPAGTLTYASGIALATAAIAAWRSAVPIEVSELGVAIQIYLPQVMAASYGSPTWGPPPPPRRAPGGGWLSADLGAPGDPDLFAALLATLPVDSPAAVIAEAAQGWRLAVCEYRTRHFADPEFPIHLIPATPDSTGLPLPAGPTLPAGPPLADGPRDGDGKAGMAAGEGPGVGAEPPPDAAGTSLPPLGDTAVCDLTAMWAGPLATWLLTRLGATVHKIEPAVRLDGTRAIDGGGIYPEGMQRKPGEDSAVWNALNYWKDRSPLDLRYPDQRDQFVALARWCDVVIDSFSPRVMPNFGLTQRVASAPGRPVLAAMPAFPEGPRRDWVAYGTGVHALLGLGDIGGGRFAAPSVTYPDPIAGFTAALAVTAALTGRDRGRPTERLEVTLYSATQPLQCFEPTDDVDHGDENPGAVLFDAGMAAGAFTPLPVAGLQLMHPRGPFRPAGAGPPQPAEGVVSG